MGSKKKAKENSTAGKAWLVSVDMGYGHQRAAYPLKEIAYRKIYTANSEKILSDEERNAWAHLRAFYEGISRFSQFPLLGRLLFWIYDNFQSISSYYPIRDLSPPTFGTLYFDYLIRKKKLCSSITSLVKSRELPYITTFYLTAIAAEKEGVKKIYCIVTDYDINRVWAPKDPGKTNIIYLVSQDRAAKRLKEYGVKEENIIITGFPLPKENIGANKSVLSHDLARRLATLDRKGIFYAKYKETINKNLGIKSLPMPRIAPCVMFCIGGAGVQSSVAKALMESLKHLILTGKIRLVISAGMHLDIAYQLKSYAQSIGLGNPMNADPNSENKKSKNNCAGLTIHHATTKKEYFESFSQLLRKTDIMWTKPSELSFYTALGIPVIISEPIGAHEKYNRRWLIEMGSGIDSKEPKYTDEWLIELIESAKLAECAWDGYMDGECMGTYNIEKAVFGKDYQE